MLLLMFIARLEIDLTLAATLGAYRTRNAGGQPLLDDRMFNGVLIMC